MGRRHPFRPPRRARGVEDGGYVIGAGADRLDRVRVGQRSVRGQVDGRGRVGERELDFGRGPARVDRDRDPARQQSPPERQHPVRPGRVAHRHPVARLEPGRVQAASHPGRRIPQLPVGQPAAAELDQRLGVRPRVNLRFQHLQQRRRQPVVPRYPVRVPGDALDRERVGLRARDGGNRHFSLLSELMDHIANGRSAVQDRSCPTG